MEYDGNNQQVSEAKYDCLLFDIDDTLYPLHSGLSAHVTLNIQEYMIEKLHIDNEKVPEMCFSLYKNYGTTMAGLKAIGYKFDYDDFHGFVHGRLPYTLLKRDATLRNLLQSIPIRKVVFTNADKAHAGRVLSRLGLGDCFEQIISFDTLNPTKKPNGANDAPATDLGEASADSSTEIIDLSKCSSSLQLPKTPVVCKPFDESFAQVFEMANINPHKTLFFDDSIRNIQTGKRMGLHTVWVGASVRTVGVDIALEHLHNIKEALPELWDSDEKSEKIEKVAMETQVRA